MNMVCRYFKDRVSDPIDCDGKIKKQQQFKPTNKNNNTLLIQYDYFVVLIGGCIILLCDGLNCCCYLNWGVFIWGGAR